MQVAARSLAGEVPATFDLNSQPGMLFVLKAIRAADISSANRNTLKDLVFLYNTDRSDEVLRIKLEATLADLGVNPESVLREAAIVTTSDIAAVTVAKDTSGFPSARPAPVFMQPVVPSALVAAIPNPVATPVPVVKETFIPKASPTAVSSPKPATHTEVKILPIERVQKIMPVVPVQAPTPATDLNVSIEKKSDEVSGGVSPVLAAPVIINNAADVSQVATNINDTNPVVTEARMERIRTIKSDVNARVGNPVNLVDVDNTVGREYMSALLEAMKLLSSASAQESDAAMKRLEKVYGEVLTLLRLSAVQNSAAEVPVSISEAATPQPVVVPVPTQSVAAPPLDVYVDRSKVSEKLQVKPTVNSWDQITLKSTAPEIDVVRSVEAAVSLPDQIMVSRMSTAPAEELRPVVESGSISQQAVTAQAVSTVTPLRAITELPTADEVSASENLGNDPLFTKDVDAGLEQLLGEWAIFKKSGLFGTGPKGRLHPLYVKIAPLQVPLILSGRFEGGTQEIKQSITDYMNGWRYEQGIVYEANETFDTYLRRVIRHIIDLQKTKRRS